MEKQPPCAPPDELAQRRAQLAQTDARERERASIQMRMLNGIVAVHVEQAGEPATSCACGGAWIAGVHVAVTVDDVDDDPSQFVIRTTSSQYIDVEGPGLQVEITARGQEP